MTTTFEVDGVPRDVEEDDVRRIFSRLGPVLSIQQVTYEGPTRKWRLELGGSIPFDQLAAVLPWCRVIRIESVD